MSMNKRSGLYDLGTDVATDKAEVKSVETAAAKVEKEKVVKPSTVAKMSTKQKVLMGTGAALVAGGAYMMSKEQEKLSSLKELGFK